MITIDFETALPIIGRVGILGLFGSLLFGMVWQAVVVRHRWKVYYSEHPDEAPRPCSVCGDVTAADWERDLMPSWVLTMLAPLWGLVLATSWTLVGVDEKEPFLLIVGIGVGFISLCALGCAFATSAMESGERNRELRKQQAESFELAKAGAASIASRENTKRAMRNFHRPDLIPGIADYLKELGAHGPLPAYVTPGQIAKRLEVSAQAVGAAMRTIKVTRTRGQGYATNDIVDAIALLEASA